VKQRLLFKSTVWVLLYSVLSACGATLPGAAVTGLGRVAAESAGKNSEKFDSSKTETDANAIGVGAPVAGDPPPPIEPKAPDAGMPAAGGGAAGDGAAGGGAAGGMPATPSMRWIVMGDFGLESLAAVPDCAPGTQQRSTCSSENSRCRSTFSTTCSSANCRRLFKCTTGQTNSLVWFPMSDGATVSATGLPICSLGMNIAGSNCSVVNDRCLSSFCTSGSGSDCGRRVFKCLTSGVEGQLFYRWMGDKSIAELTGIPQCALTENIAGSRCFGEESRCVSSFFTDAAQSKRRLFKCTP
jgi:hypothetical protein